MTQADHIKEYCKRINISYIGTVAKRIKTL